MKKTDRILVFTDLDGTLLDHRNYSFEPARPALRLLRESGIPLIICTSKTRAEVEEIRAALGNTDPFVVENGGAVFVPEGDLPIGLHAARRRPRKRKGNMTSRLFWTTRPRTWISSKK